MTDFDGDGQLDLLVTHGESAAQPISVYRVTQVRSATFRQNTKGFKEKLATLGFSINFVSNTPPPHNSISEVKLRYL